MVARSVVLLFVVPREMSDAATAPESMNCAFVRVEGVAQDELGGLGVHHFSIPHGYVCTNANASAENQ